MATLVLSTVGTALGGPVGAAIGALIGQSVDQQLLGPRSRGPRLGDLSVQSSSYGTQIPRVYGAMRVAGSVIWATDLAESAATSGAKGQPDTVYSYAVSFAVALSSRPISEIRRIWADGKLIRDVDGVFKVPTTFRFYDGSESQMIDPLIGSIEGIASTPAYRGLSLAVFENLELVEFGNRLPFLTFEIAGGEAPTVGAVLGDASSGLIASDETRTIIGYAAHGRSIGGAVEPLVSAFAIPLFDDGSHLRTPLGSVVAAGPDELGAGPGQPGPRLQRNQLPASHLPTTVRLTYYDPARDYQFGEARASLSDEPRAEEQRELAASLEAGEAKALAQQLIARAWAERDRATVRLPTRHVAIEPGTALELPGEMARWIVDRCTVEGFSCVLDLRRSITPTGTPAMLSADAGRLLPTGPDTGETTIALFETPASEQSSDGVVLLAASSTGPGWRSEQVEVKIGPQTFAERTACRKSVLGRAVARVDPDHRSFEVELIDSTQWLLSCDDDALAEGANLAMLGPELIQFGEATAIASGRYRLSNLLRGRGSGEGATVHEAGEPFVLLQRDAMRPIAIPEWVTASRITAKLARTDRCTGRDVILERRQKCKKES